MKKLEKQRFAKKTLLIQLDGDGAFTGGEMRMWAEKNGIAFFKIPASVVLFLSVLGFLSVWCFCFRLFRLASSTALFAAVLLLASLLASLLLCFSRKSPELAPIENLWKVLDERVGEKVTEQNRKQTARGRNHGPKTKQAETEPKHNTVLRQTRPASGGWGRRTPPATGGSGSSS